MKGIYKDGLLPSNTILSLPVLPLDAHISPLDSFFLLNPYLQTMAAYSESGLSVPPITVRGPSPTGSLGGSFANNDSNTGKVHRIATLPPTEDQTAKAFSTSSTTAYVLPGSGCFST
jgi:hypothetical protein